MKKIMAADVMTIKEYWEYENLTRCEKINEWAYERGADEQTLEAVLSCVQKQIKRDKESLKPECVGTNPHLKRLKKLYKTLKNKGGKNEQQ